VLHADDPGRRTAPASDAVTLRDGACGLAGFSGEPTVRVIVAEHAKDAGYIGM
jgi:hypothetical protein